jgi:hypothetical protein
LQAQIGRDKVIEEAAIPGGREVSMAGNGKFILLLSGNAPFPSRD